MLLRRETGELIRDAVWQVCLCHKPNGKLHGKLKLLSWFDGDAVRQGKHELHAARRGSH